MGRVVRPVRPVGRVFTVANARHSVAVHRFRSRPAPTRRSVTAAHRPMGPSRARHLASAPYWVERCQPESGVSRDRAVCRFDQLKQYVDLKESIDVSKQYS